MISILIPQVIKYYWYWRKSPTVIDNTCLYFRVNYVDHWCALNITKYCNINGKSFIHEDNFQCSRKFRLHMLHMLIFLSSLFWHIHIFILSHSWCWYSRHYVAALQWPNILIYLWSKTNLKPEHVNHSNNSTICD